MTAQSKDDAASERLMHRAITFSDAVFAVALTLLVLELRPPPRDVEVVDGLLALLPHLAAFAGSFALVAIFWAAHMALTRRLVVFDWPTVWVNLLFMFVIVLMPFASALLGGHGVTPLVWRLYCGVLIAASLAQTALWLVASRGGGRLLAGGVTWRERGFRTLRALSPAIAFGVGFWAVGTELAQWSVWCWVLILPVALVARLVFGGKH